MKIEIKDYAIWKFPNNNLSHICWIWLSEKHSSIFFSLKRKLAIYNHSQREWQEISLEDYECNTECAEALTISDDYLVFAGFAGNFEVYELQHLKYLKTIDTENSGYGAAAFKNNVFMNDHDPWGIKMVEIPSGMTIREFPAPDILSEDYLLNSISSNENYVIGFFENVGGLKGEGVEYSYYIIWNFHDGSLVSKIPTESEGFEDPILLKDNLIINDNKICNLISSEVLIELDLPEYEFILTALDDYVFTLSDDYNEENKMKRIRVYNKKVFYENMEFEVDEIHMFKNTGDHVLILKEDYFYLISLKSLMPLFKSRDEAGKDH